MLATVALDSDSLGLLNPSDRAAEEASHRILIDGLLNHGLLVFARDSDREQFLDKVRTLHEPIRVLWTTAIERLAWVTSERLIEHSLKELIDEGGELSTTWGGAVLLALAERDRAALIGLPLTQATIIDPCGIEIARMEQASASTKLKVLQVLAYSAIHAGQTRDAVWQERFEPVACHTQKVTILDRYAMDGHRRSSKSGQESGLGWLLRKCTDVGVRHVHLITRAKRQKKAFEELLAIRAHAEGLSSLTVTFSPEPAFQQYAHGRHIRFDMWGFALDRGCELFSDPIIKEESSTQYGDSKSARSREHKLERAARKDELRRRVWP